MVAPGDDVGAGVAVHRCRPHPSRGATSDARRCGGRRPGRACRARSERRSRCRPRLLRRSVGPRRRRRPSSSVLPRPRPRHWASVPADPAIAAPPASAPPVAAPPGPGAAPPQLPPAPAIACPAIPPAPAMAPHVPSGSATSSRASAARPSTPSSRQRTSELTAPRTPEQKMLLHISRRPPSGRSSFAPPQSPTVAAADRTCAALSDMAKAPAPHALLDSAPPVSRKDTTPLKDARPRADEPDFIVVRGAREHNLGIDELRIPKRSLVVFTGVSGSGKSSLAFDTLYAEGQRRYVESLSSYARQFLGQMEKPKYEQLRGLSPDDRHRAEDRVVEPALDGRHRHRDLRLPARALRARGRAALPPVRRRGDGAVGRRDRRRAADAAGEDARSTLLAPQGRATARASSASCSRRRARPASRACASTASSSGSRTSPALDKKKKHTIELVVDRVSIDAGERARLTDSVETALKAGGGSAAASLVEGEDARARLQRDARLPDCGVGLPELSPQSFSFNSPLGMCVDCNGLGTRLEVDPDLVVPDPEPVDRRRRHRAVGRPRRHATGLDRRSSRPPCRASSASRSTSRGRS